MLSPLGTIYCSCTVQQSIKTSIPHLQTERLAPETITDPPFPSMTPYRAPWERHQHLQPVRPLSIDRARRVAHQRPPASVAKSTRARAPLQATVCASHSNSRQRERRRCRRCGCCGCCTTRSPAAAAAAAAARPIPGNCAGYAHRARCAVTAGDRLGACFVHQQPQGHAFVFKESIRWWGSFFIST